MNRKLLRPVALAVSLLATTFGAGAHGDQAHDPPRVYDAKKIEPTAFGQQGDPGKATRRIAIDMADDMRFTPADVTVRKGETVRFVVHNEGKLMHEMVLGSTQALREHAALMKKFPEMEHADANMAHVRPGATGELVWQFTQAGEFRFACLQPGHFEAGMVGKVTVK